MTAPAAHSPHMSTSAIISEPDSATPALEVLRTPTPSLSEGNHAPAPTAPPSTDLPGHAALPTPSRPPGAIRRFFSWFYRNPLFLLAVAAPTLIATSYFGFFSPDVFLSESRFVIRSPQAKAPSGLGALLQGHTLARSHDDTFTVHDFIQSRDALRVLSDKLALREAFSLESKYKLDSFPGFDEDASFEAFYRYFKKHISVSADSSSGISVLAVRAFRPEDAHRINQILLEMSEKLINDLNTRARQDMIQFATSEVKQAESKARAAALALSAYRNEKQVFDPERQSAVQLQQIARLQDELIASKTQLAQIEDASIQSPQIQALKKKIQILNGEISSETSKVVGADASLAHKAAEYERLSLDRTFAEKSLATALASLETARNEAQRKQLYLERIVEPSLPDRSFEPKRVKGTVEVFLLGLIAWGIGSMLIAGVREHQD